MKPILKILAFVLLGGIFASGVAVVAGVWVLFAAPNPDDAQTIRVEIPQGASQTRIGNILEEKKLIKSEFGFRLAVRLQNLGGSLQAGVYELAPNNSAFEIAQKLTRNTSDIRVTIPEGHRAEEVVEILATQLGTDQAGAETCLQYNGFLFPETYSFVPGTTLQQACQRLRNQFDTQWEALLSTSPARDQWDQDDLVNLAALVQREAKKPEDMRRVAGILFNRLEIGMPLQIDATLQYAKGYDSTKKTWWPVPLAADKNIDSPYNTYMHTGLPAGSIANPGKDALHAVLNPTPSQDIYYISTLDGSQMFFTPSYEVHLQNINRYLRR